MKNTKPAQKYYNIMTTEGADEATILMYGYIGEMWQWNPEVGYEQVGVTDIEFVKELEQLSAKYNTIHVRINSPGGEIFHGSAIVTAIKNCTAEVHTWIDGVAASMAGIIWMAGKKRHMAKNGMLMLHSACGICWGNGGDMQTMASLLGKFDESLIISAADSVGATEDTLKAKYFNYKDHWLTFNDVKAEGWLSDPEEYEAAAKLPSDMEHMKYRDLVAFFEQQEKTLAADQPSLFAQFKAWLDEAKTAIIGTNPPQSSSPTQEDMNISDFKASLADGKLNLDEVKAHLESLTPPTPPAATDEPGGDDDEESFTALRAELDATKAEMKTLADQIKAFGAQPGEGKSTPGMPDSDLPSADGAESIQARYNKANAELSAAADNNLTPKFVISE